MACIPTWQQTVELGIRVPPLEGERAPQSTMVLTPGGDLSACSLGNYLFAISPCTPHALQCKLREARILFGSLLFIQSLHRVWYTTGAQ